MVLLYIIVYDKSISTMYSDVINQIIARILKKQLHICTCTRMTDDDVWNKCILRRIEKMHESLHFIASFESQTSEIWTRSSKDQPSFNEWYARGTWNLRSQINARTHTHAYTHVSAVERTLSVFLISRGCTSDRVKRNYVTKINAFPIHRVNCVSPAGAESTRTFHQGRWRMLLLAKFNGRLLTSVSNEPCDTNDARTSTNVGNL